MKPVYHFGFRLACLVAILIVLSLLAMTFAFIIGNPGIIKEVSQCFKEVLLALIAVLGVITKCALRWTTYQRKASKSGGKKGK